MQMQASSILILLIITLYFASGQIILAIPQESATPGSAANITQFFQNLQFPILPTTFYEFPPSWLGKKPLSLNAISFSNLSLNHSKIDFEFIQSNGLTNTTAVLYKCKEGSALGIIDLNWIDENGGKGEAKAMASFEKLNFYLELQQSSSSRLQIALKLQDFSISEINISSGIEDEQTLKKAQDLLAVQVVGNLTLFLENQLKTKLLPLHSALVSKTLSRDSEVVWEHSRLQPYGKAVDLKMLTPPVISGGVVFLHFQGKLPPAPDHQISLRQSKQFKKLRELQAISSNKTCIAFTQDMLASGLSNCLHFYTKLLYFNRALLTQVPASRSYSPFYLFEAAELTMWGPDLWGWLSQRFGVIDPIKMRQFINSELKFDCLDHQFAKLHLEPTLNKVEGSSLKAANGTFQSHCNILLALSPETWEPLFSLSFTLGFDLILKYGGDSDFPRILSAGVANVKLINLESLGNGPEIFTDDLIRRGQFILKSLQLEQSLEVLGHGVKALPLKKDSITMERTEEEVMVCGELYFPTN